MRFRFLLALGLIVAPVNAIAQSEPAIVAVFDIEFSGIKLKKGAIKGLNEYLFSKVAGAAQFQVVPQSKLRAQLRAEKAESYKQCYDESCQIEIGKELAAEKSLSSKVLKLGQDCLVTVALYDLRTAATEAASDATGGCGVGALVRSLEAATRGLTRVPAPTGPAQPLGVEDRERCPDPGTRRMGEPYPDGQSVYCVNAEGKMQGTLISWQNSGKLAMTATYKQGKLHGPQSTFHANGTVSTYGDNKNGRKEGAWTTYYDSGAKLESGTYVRGQKTGLWTRYRADGTKDELTNYKEDAKHGAYVEYDAHGQKEEEGQFEAGKREGLWTDYRRDGSPKKTRSYKRGVREGPSSTYDADGHRTALEAYLGGKKHGPMKYWRMRDGKLVVERTQTYQRGRRQGVEMRFFRTGEPRYRYTYDKDEKTGPSTEWRLSRGQHYVSRKGSYLRGKREGLWESMDSEGHVLKEEHYEKGKLQGRSKYWRVNKAGERSLQRVANYSTGKRHGMQIHYQPDGSVKKEVEYTMGKRKR